jgi:diaminopimelate epimerase
MTVAYGREFYKLTGSGNDFVFVDARAEPAGRLAEPAVVAAICARGTGVGADGIVFIEPAEDAAFGIRYLNRDGSPAALCGNAALCSTRLAVELGVADAAGFSFATDAGVVRGRLAGDLPEIELQPVTAVQADAERIATTAGEHRIGFALVGVPHLVVLRDELEGVDVAGRGRVLRHDATLRAGANVNFVAPSGGGNSRWTFRTYERGVEAETLACGTGAVACAALLAAWGLGGLSYTLQTRSGQSLEVELERTGSGATRPLLRGEGRIVYRGRLGEV